jgi:uncharacterized damage-inducible protein DinB
MQTEQMNLIDKMFEYNLWANSQLIAICEGLDDAQLEIEVAGGFGKIHPTLVHLIRAEGGYLNRMTGKRPWTDDLDWENMSIATLQEKAQLSGNQLIATASNADPATKHTYEHNGTLWPFYNWTVLLQALYHGIEHRTQIKVLLTQLGVKHPDLDAWDYVESLSLSE